MYRTTTLAGALLTALAFAPALAQEEGPPRERPTVSVAQSDKYGEYLIGPEGKPLYMFTTDTQGGPDQEPKISCGDECLDAWPLAPVEGEATVGPQLNSALLGTMTYQGERVATYNGWPLYTYVRDEAGEPPTGQDIHSFGGEWYLLTPEGEKLEREG